MMPGITDTEDCLKSARELADSIYGLAVIYAPSEVAQRFADACFNYLTGSVRAYERAVKLGMLPTMGGAVLPDPAEELGRAVADRDEAEEAIARIRQQIEDSPDTIRSVLEMTVLDPQLGRLKWCEDRIASIQKRIETASPVE